MRSPVELKCSKKSLKLLEDLTPAKIDETKTSGGWVIFFKFEKE